MINEKKWVWKNITLQEFLIKLVVIKETVAQIYLSIYLSIYPLYLYVFKIQIQKKKKICIQFVDASVIPERLISRSIRSSG